MLPHLSFPLLPPPPSWYPGHMTKFVRSLPTLLHHTDVVLEIRDSRLPLTSINGKLEGAIQRWRRDRGRAPTQSTPRDSTSPPPTHVVYPEFTRPCERIVVFNKRDLVPEWGIEPFRAALESRYPDQTTFFASWHKHRDIKALNEMLVKIARRYPHAHELNILVLGMPNVGKSTLLNALRDIGISGPTSKALRTSSLPGMTRALSTRLKLSEDPLVYSYDTPGVMLPFLGRGDIGAERGVKLALIAGIKEGLYDKSALAAYLLYRLNVINPSSPAYLTLLPPEAAATADDLEFLDLLAKRLGMLKRGGMRDATRAADYFIRWWREDGCLISASSPSPSSLDATGLFTQRAGWGFDFEWSIQDQAHSSITQQMEACIDANIRDIKSQELAGENVSATQEKKTTQAIKKQRQREKGKERRVKSW